MAEAGVGLGVGNDCFQTELLKVRSYFSRENSFASAFFILQRKNQVLP